MITDLTIAKNIVTERIGGATLPIDIDNRLSSSAGTSGNTTAYRPYFVAGRILDQDIYPVENTPDARFRGRDATVDALMREQQGYDKADDLSIPLGMEALTSAERGRAVAPVSGVINPNRVI